jgi:ribonuclease HII
MSKFAEQPEEIGYIDEVGRNSIAGDLYACCVVGSLPFIQYEGIVIDDSKKLKPEERNILWNILKDKICYGIGVVSVEEINKLKNVHKANLLAFARSIKNCGVKIKSVFIDGKYHIPDENLNSLGLEIEQYPIVQGDSKILNISAASIMAKVELDKVMIGLHNQYPHYGFNSNMGYACPHHFMALKKYGVTKHHRYWMNQIRKVMSGSYDSVIFTKYRNRWEKLNEAA